MRVYARFASHPLGLSVFAFSTISHGLMPQLLDFDSTILRILIVRRNRFATLSKLFFCNLEEFPTVS